MEQTTEVTLLGEDQPIDRRIAVFEKSVPVLATAGPILLANQARISKALSVGQDIMVKIKSGGMTDDLDARAMKFLANSSAALKEIKEGRSGVTQIADELKKLFTSLEAQIDPKKPTIVADIQEARNAYAKKKAQEEAEKKAAIARETERKAQLINLKYSAVNALENYFLDAVKAKKEQLLASFNSTTLETYATQVAKFERFEPVYDKASFLAFYPTLISPVGSTGARLFSDAELTEISQETLTGEKYAEFNATFQAELSIVKQDCLDKFPTKKRELEDAKARAEEAERKRVEEIQRQKEAEVKRQAELTKQKDAEARKRLELKQEAEKKAEADLLAKIEADRLAEEQRVANEQRLRDEKEKERIEAEDAESRAKAQAQADNAKTGEATMLLFEQEAAVAEVISPTKARAGYEIVILHPAGWAQVFQFWYENAGKDLDNAKIGRTTMDQMKAFAEKKAHKDDHKIQSKVIVYEETFTAVNKKSDVGK